MSSRRVTHNQAGSSAPGVGSGGTSGITSGVSAGMTPVRAVPEVCTPDPRSRRSLRVLVVASGRSIRERLEAQMDAIGARTMVADSAEDLPEMLAAHRFDVVLLSTDLGPDCHALASLLGDRAVSVTSVVPSVVIVSEAPTVEQATAAMRAGACDLVGLRVATDELATRLEEAAARGRARRQEARRVVRLKRMCRRLNSARRDVVGQIESLCDDLSDAYAKLSDKMTKVAISSEFNSLVRQELDVEGLLRTVLEYALAKIGPTNAAVFLPSSTGEHTLGAYVNYDVPKDAAEVLLDHLTSVLPHKFGHIEQPEFLSGDRDLLAALGEDAHWLEGRSLVVLPCRKDDQTLAMVAFFRDASTPFTQAHAESCEIIAELFGRQIGRVIHVHHRHLPMDEWGMPGDPVGR